MSVSTVTELLQPLPLLGDLDHQCPVYPAVASLE
jgi:hypothetical protein